MPLPVDGPYEHNAVADRRSGRGLANTLTTEKYYGSLSNSLAVENVANMVAQRSMMMGGEGAPRIGFGGFGNIGVLIGSN